MFATDKPININTDKMASIAMLVSEIAHSLKQPNNQALRENIKSAIIHIRAELIRHSYEQHGYVDKVITQRYRVQLQDVVDGDINLKDFDSNTIDDYDLDYIKRTKQKVPKPIRLTNNLPFDRVSSVGWKTNREFPYIKETSARFRGLVPGLSGMPCYDYINGYIYIFPQNCEPFNLQQIVIESAFEHPTPIQIDNGEVNAMDALMDENEWLLPEDMVGQIKDIVYKRENLQTVRETNEIPNTIKL